jgi:predicted choloylglycine hydrolase
VNDMKNIKITTNICDKHFAILRYESGDMIDAKKVFNKLNYKFDFKETWFLLVDGMIFSISFCLYTWSRYKSMIYARGISKNFREGCVKNRCGSLVMKPDDEFKILYKFNQERSNQELKNSIQDILTKK